MQNPLSVKARLSHCGGLAKGTAPITTVFFVTKENLKWWWIHTALHKQWPCCQRVTFIPAKSATKMRRENAMRKDKSDQHLSPQRDPPNSTAMAALCHHRILWIKKMTSKTNLRRQLMNVCSRKSHHQMFPFPRVLETSQGPIQAPSLSGGLQSQTVCVYIHTHTHTHTLYNRTLTSDIFYLFWIRVLLYNTPTSKLKCQLRQSTRSCFLIPYTSWEQSSQNVTFRHGN